MTATTQEQNRLVLLVEDDEANRDALAELLTVEGYRVAAVTNGREALDYLAASELPGLILLDLLMPVMDAWEFRAEQRRDARLASIPVLLLSAGSRIEEQAEELGAVGVIGKPPQLDQLLGYIDRYCRG